MCSCIHKFPFRERPEKKVIDLEISCKVSIHVEARRAVAGALKPKIEACRNEVVARRSGIAAGSSW